VHFFVFVVVFFFASFSFIIIVSTSSSSSSSSSFSSSSCSSCCSSSPHVAEQSYHSTATACRVQPDVTFGEALSYSLDVELPMSVSSALLRVTASSTHRILTNRVVSLGSCVTVPANVCSDTVCCCCCCCGCGAALEQCGECPCGGSCPVCCSQ
jgi:hypothetical protein